MQYQVETTYDAEKKPQMTTVYKHIPVEYGVERVVVVAFPGWYSTDDAINVAKKLKHIK